MLTTSIIIIIIISHTGARDSAVLALLSVRPVGNYFSPNAYSNGNENLSCLTGDFHFDSQMLLTHGSGYVQCNSGVFPLNSLSQSYVIDTHKKKHLPTIVGGINNSLVFLLYFHALMPGIPGAVNKYGLLVRAVYLM